LNDPQSLHKYLYTHADPVNGTDPTGMFGLGGAMLGASLAGHIASVKSSVDIMVFEAVVATIEGVQAGMTAGEILSKYMTDQIEGILFGFVIVKAGAIISNIFENGITVLSAVRRSGNTSQRPIVLISNRRISATALEQDIKVLGKSAPPAIRVDNVRIDSHFKDIVQRQRVKEWHEWCIKTPGASSIRVDQTQVSVSGTRLGENRPDYQFTLSPGEYTLPNGSKIKIEENTRIYVEFDNVTSNRANGHLRRIAANDRNGIIVLESNNSEGVLSSDIYGI
jgi:hypothetical protein